MLGMKSISHQTLPRNSTTLEQRAFAVAFCPADKLQPNIAKLWSERTTEAIKLLVNFRSSIHRWQANGEIPDNELVQELDNLSEFGLDGLIDELIGLSNMATMAGEL